LQVSDFKINIRHLFVSALCKDIFGFQEDKFMAVLEGRSIKLRDWRSLDVWRPLVVGLLCLLPLFLTPVLPSIDFYSHIARYYILANNGNDLTLSESYQINWKLLPNLGMDILGTGVMMIMPPLLAAKALAGIVILAPFFGALYLARSLNERVTSINVTLAGILTYNLILGWGFSNFLLGLGIALWGIGWWISQASHPYRQLLVTMGLGIILLFIHGLVFGLWGLMLVAVELMLISRKGPVRLSQLTIGMGRLLLVAALPVILFFQMKTASADGGITTAASNLTVYNQNGLLWSRLWDEVLQRFDGILRVAESSWPIWDRLFGFTLWSGIIAGLIFGCLRLDRRLLLAVALIAAMVWFMPPNLFGVGHLDERMPLVLLALLAGGLSLSPSKNVSRHLSLFFKALFVLHLAMVSFGWFKEGESYEKYLATLDDLKPGGLGAALFVDEAALRDQSRSCKPLLFILLLKNNTLVSTFSNPTEQPLEIKGKLLAAKNMSSAVYTNAEKNTGAKIEKLFSSGFDTVVTCDMTGKVLELETGILVAHAEKWAIYQRTSLP
jgi:hypothetical protein